MALNVAEDQSVTAVDWDNIDTVLLDMDGTLLDLRFDTDFWVNTVPLHYARLGGISVEAARAVLDPIFAREQGHLNWYCLDFWSETVGFDVAELKRTLASGIAWRPLAELFLKRLHASHCRVALITNAHPETLRIKLEQVALEPWLDDVVTSHQFDAPKEYQAFWEELQKHCPFEPARTLFIDDSESVLDSAQRFGIGNLITMRQPDSAQPLRRATRFPAVLHFDELFEGLPHVE